MFAFLPSTGSPCQIQNAECLESENPSTGKTYDFEHRVQSEVGESDLPVVFRELQIAGTRNLSF